MFCFHISVFKRHWVESSKINEQTCFFFNTPNVKKCLVLRPKSAAETSLPVENGLLSTTIVRFDFISKTENATWPKTTSRGDDEAIAQTAKEKGEKNVPEIIFFFFFSQRTHRTPNTRTHIVHIVPV